VRILRDDLTDGEILAYLLSAEHDSACEPFLLGDRRLDLRDLTLFTGLRSLTLEDVLTPYGYDLSAEAGFAVIYQ